MKGFNRSLPTIYQFLKNIVECNKMHKILLFVLSCLTNSCFCTLARSDPRPSISYRVPKPGPVRDSVVSKGLLTKSASCLDILENHCQYHQNVSSVFYQGGPVMAMFSPQDRLL